MNFWRVRVICPAGRRKAALHLCSGIDGRECIIRAGVSTAYATAGTQGEDRDQVHLKEACGGAQNSIQCLTKILWRMFAKAHRKRNCRMFCSGAWCFFLLCFSDNILLISVWTDCLRGWGEYNKNSRKYYLQSEKQWVFTTNKVKNNIATMQWVPESLWKK